VTIRDNVEKYNITIKRSKERLMSYLEGGCLCGYIRYQLNSEPLGVALCHCADCRRASGAPAVSWAVIPERDFEITAGEISSWKSSELGKRFFCPQCGTQIAFAASYMPGLVDVTVCRTDKPELLSHSMHIWESMRLPWLELADESPRHLGFPPQ